MPWGAVAGGVISAIGSMGAASTAAGAASNAQAIQQQEFNTITAQEQPWMSAGGGAQNELNYLLGITPATPSGQGWGAGSTIPGEPGSGKVPGGKGGPGDYGGVGVPGGPGYGSLLTPFTEANWKQLSPMYNFQLQQGGQGVLNQDAGAQGAESGAALKDLMSFNQGYANSSFNNAFQLYNQQQGNIYNRLFGLSQLGQNAAANTGQRGTTLAGNAGSAAVAAGNAIGGGISSAANSAGNSLATYGALQTLNAGNYPNYTGTGGTWGNPNPATGYWDPNSGGFVPIGGGGDVGGGPG